MSNFEKAKAEYAWWFQGSPRAGKTNLVKRLLQRTPRYVVLDRKGEYGDVGGISTRSEWPGVSAALQAAADGGPLRLAVQSRTSPLHLATMRYLWTIHRETDAPPTALVVEEAKDFSDPNRGFIEEPESLAVSPDGTTYQEKIYTEGLDYGLIPATVSQFPSQVARDVTKASVFRVSVRYDGALPPELRAAFKGQRKEMANLEVVTPDTSPEKGTHYLTHPKDLELEEEWLGQFR